MVLTALCVYFNLTFNKAVKTVPLILTVMLLRLLLKRCPQAVSRLSVRSLPAEQRISKKRLCTAEGTEPFCYRLRMISIVNTWFSQVIFIMPPYFPTVLRILPMP